MRRRDRSAILAGEDERRKTKTWRASSCHKTVALYTKQAPGQPGRNRTGAHKNLGCMYPLFDPRSEMVAIHP